MRLSVRKDVRYRLSHLDPMIFKYNNTEFDIYSAKSKHFYSPLITNKAYHPKRFNTLLTDLELSNALQEVLSIPHNVASETYY